MKANELRIGNVVGIGDLHIGTTTMYLGAARIFDVKLIKSNQINIHQIDNKGFGTVLPEELQPIPLTPELLEKCGFKSNHPTYYYIPIEDNCLHVYYSNNGLYGYNVKYMHAYLGEIKYLHQLQNLYFALTGEELEIDLKTLQQ
ncbi:MAG: hypothetical protein LLG05_08460 [Porphyromonadaceae bacterium]|jgi:hypothetical protein|nr:hypothetical protein [Porphyromonadaceae bacterium]